VLAHLKEISNRAGENLLKGIRSRRRRKQKKKRGGLTVKRWAGRSQED